MNMIKLHEEALSGTAGPFHEFLLFYTANKPIVYGFVEGKEDPNFYEGLINNLLPRNWRVRLVKAGKRNSVLSLLGEFDWSRFPRKRIAFFVDRDLSEFMDEPLVSSENLYVTDNYSIENDIVAIDVFRRIIRELFEITALNDTEAQLIERIFDENLSLFCETLAPIMAQIVIWLRGEMMPILDEIRLDAIFGFSRAEMFVRDAYKTTLSRVNYASQCVKLPPSPQNILSTVEAEFRERGGVDRFIRGKYLLWFFVEFALSVQNSISELSKNYKKPPKYHCTFSISNAMLHIGPRARLPPSLQAFIRDGYVTYIKMSEQN